MCIYQIFFYLLRPWHEIIHIYLYINLIIYNIITHDKINKSSMADILMLFRTKIVTNQYFKQVDYLIDWKRVCKIINISERASKML